MTHDYGRDTRTITRRLVTARRLFRKMDVIPQQDRSITEGNIAALRRELDGLQAMLEGN